MPFDIVFFDNMKYNRPILTKGNTEERRTILMTNADLVWRLVELLIQQDKDLKQVALDQIKKDKKPNDQKQNEA